MLEEIQKSVPRFQLGAAFERGTRLAIGRCLQRSFTAAEPNEKWGMIFRTFGKIEFEEGRSLDDLQTAYRIGARVAWKHVSAMGRSAGLSADILCRCAEAIFTCVDEISGLSIEGYAAAQNHSAATLTRHRRRLLELVVAHPPTPARTMAAHATSAHWSLPREVAVVILEPRTTRTDIEIPDLRDEILADLNRSEPCLITADPVRDIQDLNGMLSHWRAVVGPTVPLADAASSLARARQVMQLLRRGIIAEMGITWCADHLLTLSLLADEILLAQLCARALAPLTGLTPKRRASLADTLLAWLQSRGGSAPEIAAKLNVHPQTVRYRLHQLTDLFGEKLDNADDRLDIEIALRAEPLLAIA